MEFDKIEIAKQTLRNAGYFVDNLWHIDDVRDEFICPDDDAMCILGDVLTNGMLTTRINEMIQDECISNGLRRREDEE